MFVSIYKYILYKLQRMVAGSYLDDLSAQVAHQQSLVQEREVTIVQQGQQLYDAEKRLESVQEDQPVSWVMSAETYSKFCKEFEPPVVSRDSSPTDAAFKLGIQRVLSRIGERYVSR